MDDHHLPHRSSSGEISCSICHDLVHANGVRSRAKLKCGHQFHLDCIGSAFNMKGEMQCPNCREVENGQWLYVNGPNRTVPEFSVEDWVPEEDMYEMGYTEMPYRFHWCPFEEASPQHLPFESDRRTENALLASVDPRTPDPIARARARVQAYHDRHHHQHHHHHQHQPHHHHHHHGMPSSTGHSSWMFDGHHHHRGSPAQHQPRDQSVGFYSAPPSSSSERNAPEAEHPFHRCGGRRGQERHYPIAFPERDSTWGTPYHHSYGGQDSSGNRSSTLRNGPWSSQ